MMGSFRFAKYDNTGVGIDDPNATATFAKSYSSVPGDGVFATFADLIAGESTAAIGDTATCQQALIAGGLGYSRWQFDGAKYRPLGQQTLLIDNAAYVGIATTSDQLLASYAVVAGVLNRARLIMVDSVIAKSGTVNTPTCRVRHSAAADLLGGAWSAYTYPAASNRQQSLGMALRPMSDTVLRSWASSLTGIGLGGAGSASTAYPQDIAAIDMGATTYINVCAQNSSTDVPSAVAMCVRIL